MSDDSYVIQMRYEAACAEADAAHRRGKWAVVYGLAPFLDGNQWCVLLGADIQSGVVGFGATPADAINAFEQAMTATAPKGSKT